MSVYFIEGNVSAFSTQLTKFSVKLPTYAADLGFSVDEKKEAVDDAAYMAWIVKTDEDSATSKLAWKAYELLAREGSVDVTVLIPPSAFVITVSPTLVEPGIQRRFAEKAAKAKANPKCSEAIQKDLGIYSAPDAAVTITPDLKVASQAGHPELIFTKHGFLVINLYRDAGTGYGTAPYKTLTKSHFVDYDLPAVGVTAHYKYKIVFVENDVEVGNFSPEVSINVIGR